MQSGIKEISTKNSLGRTDREIDRLKQQKKNQNFPRVFFLPEFVFFLGDDRKNV